MTTRERREARAARLNGWAEKREAKSATMHAAGDMREEVSGIPMGQPVMSQRHRNAIDKANAATRRALANDDKAASMRSRAANIEAAADNAIYSDDEDAIERLRARIAEREAERAAMKAANADFKARHKSQLAALSPFMRGQALPHPPYTLTNLAATIRRDKARLVEMECEPS